MNKTLAAVIFAATSAQTLYADEGQFYLAPSMQIMNYDNGTGFDNELGYGIGLGYDFTSRLSGEFSVLDLDPQVPNEPSVDQDLWKIDLLYDLDLDWGKVQPFVVSGLGSSNIDGDNDSIWNIGAGINVPLSDRLSWRNSLRNYYFLGRDSEDQDLGFASALVYRFGVSKAASRPASVTAPVADTTQTRAPADADLDGVSDRDDKCPGTMRSYAVDEDGCPIPIEEVARVELLVNFDFDKADVKAEYLSEIEDVARFMEQHPDVVVELEGHTDSRGTDAYNLDLSQRRADAVRAELIGRFEVAASRITARGFGESQPVASNDSNAGRASNRRVITVIIKTLQRYQPR